MFYPEYDVAKLKDAQFVSEQISTEAKIAALKSFKEAVCISDSDDPMFLSTCGSYK